MCVRDKQDFNVPIEIKIYLGLLFFLSNTNIFRLTFVDIYKYIRVYKKMANMNSIMNTWTFIGKYKYKYKYLLHTKPKINMYCK